MAKKFSLEKITNILVLTLFGALLILGGLGIESLLTGVFGVVLGVSLLIYIYAKEKRVSLPRGTGLYLIFLLFFVLSILWADSKTLVLQNFLLFLAGGLFWLVFYNSVPENPELDRGDELNVDMSSSFRRNPALLVWGGRHNLGQKFKKDFFWLIIFLGIVFGTLFLAEQVLPGAINVKSYSLYLPAGVQRNHNHLGDLWALVLIAVIYLFVKERKWWNLPLGVLGIYFLGVSLSRSAYISLLVGLAYLFDKFGWVKKFKSIFIALLTITTGLFLYAGSLKSILSSRPYFAQAIRGLGKHPFGVGVGNFSQISNDPQIAGEGAKHFSFLTHNLVLEITSGLGIFGFVFVAWLVFQLKGLLISKREEPIGVFFTAIFFALFTNFMFDYTYMIPTMLWLWFVSLGLAQKINK